MDESVRLSRARTARSATHVLVLRSLYRLSNRTSLGAKFRHGSNYPITGLNRRNERNVPYSVDRNGRVSSATDSLLPIVPSAGFVVEF